jgi:hypothetical protein
MILCDTGPLVAAFNESDRHRSRPGSEARQRATPVFAGRKLAVAGGSCKVSARPPWGSDTGPVQTGAGQGPAAGQPVESAPATNPGSSTGAVSTATPPPAFGP